MIENLSDLSRLFTTTFAVTSLLSMGLGMTVAEIIEPLRNVRLTIMALVANFVVVPAAALLISHVIPLEQDLRTGLILVSLVAGAPLTVKLAQIAKGDAAFGVALVALLVVGTVIYLPIVLPLVLPGVAVDAGALISLALMLVLTLGLNIGDVLGLFGTGAIISIVLLIAAGLFAGYPPGRPDSGTKRVLSALFFLYQSSTDISVVELVERPGGRIEEREPPRVLPSNAVTVLDVYGHLFYAGARALARRLPQPGEALNPVVILRLRGRTTIEATLIEVLTSYAAELEAVNGRLYLTGISERVHDQYIRTGKLRKADPVHVYDATPIRGESTREAVADVQTWLVRVRDEATQEEATPDGVQTVRSELE